jgi:hypothetical protein
MSYSQQTSDFRGHTDIGWKVDGHWGEWGVSIKTSLHTTRDLRAALLTMAYAARFDASSKWACVLVNTRMTNRRLQDELALFRATVAGDVAERVWLGKTQKDGKLEGHGCPIPTDWLDQLVQQEVARATPLVRGASQYEVLSLLTLHWLQGAPPQSADAICQAAGVSYPTLVAVLKELDVDHAIERDSSRKVHLNRLPQDAWKRWALAKTRVRKTVRFVDHAGQARSPEEMVQRLTRLKLGNVAVAGILGAKHYYPQLDITASPRLDLTVHGDNINLDFVDQLDPGLQRSTHTADTPQLVVHYLLRPQAFFEVDSDGTVWADPVECLADLFEARLNTQADEMLFAMKAR